jgi:hypothetical protein
MLDTTRCVDLAALLGAASTGLLSISPPWITVGDFREPLVGTSPFQITINCIKIKIIYYTILILKNN